MHNTAVAGTVRYECSKAMEEAHCKITESTKTEIYLQYNTLVCN